MRKRTIKTKLFNMMIFLGIVLILFCILNMSALNAIKEYNSSIGQNFSIIQGDIQDTDAQAQSEIVRLVRLNGVKVNGTYIFDIILLILGVVVTVVAIAIANRTIARPAKVANEDLEEIISKLEEGRGDLTKRVRVTSEDEIGDLSSGVNKFMDLLQELMVKVHAASESMYESVEKVNNLAKRSDDSATNVSAVTEQLAASMQQISATVEELNASSAEIVERISEMNQKSTEGASEMSNIKRHADEMHREAIKSKQLSQDTFTEVEATLQKAVEESKDVDKINSLTQNILEIASQTNLLALNASIEAARAGEAGKGFAVVADEIRKLADDSRETANSIQEISQSVTASVEKLSDSASTMLDFVNTTVMNDYDKFVDIISEYQKDSDSASEQFESFAEDSNTITVTLKDMNSGIADIVRNVEESSTGITGVAKEATDLVTIITDITNQTNINKTLSDELQTEVNQFEKI